MNSGLNLQAIADQLRAQLIANVWVRANYNHPPQSHERERCPVPHACFAPSHSIHEGEVLGSRQGQQVEKWVLSKWIRQRAFEVDVAAFAEAA